MPDVTRTSFNFIRGFSDPGSAALSNMPPGAWSASSSYRLIPNLMDDIGPIDAITGIRVRVSASRTDNLAVNPVLYIAVGTATPNNPWFFGVFKNSAISTTSPATYTFGGLADNWGIESGDYLWGMQSGDEFGIRIYGRNPDSFYNCGISAPLTEVLVRFTQRGQPGMLAFSL